jgi:hypothetical protein
MTGFTIGYDCTRANLPSVPRGAQLAGYATGIGSGIPWTAADWAAHPGAIRIAQAASLPADEAVHADVLDVEAGAATISECAPWARDAMASFAAVRRPGQRRPAIYFSASNVHAVVNALIAGGVTSGVGLWIADWNLSQAQAVADVLAGAGPFPVIGVQFRNAGPYDCDIWSSAWLADVSRPTAPAPPPPPPVSASSYPPPSHLSQTVQPIPVHFGWEPGTPLSPHWRWQLVHWAGGKPGEVVASDVATSPHFAVTVPGPGEYAWRVQAAGDSPFTGWRVFTA